MAERTRGWPWSHTDLVLSLASHLLAVVKGFTSLTLSFLNCEMEIVTTSPQNCLGFPRYPESSTVPGTGMTSSYKLWLRITQNNGIT